MKSLKENRVRFFTFAFFVLFLFSLVLSPAISVGAEDLPKGVHLTWSKNDTHSSMTVSWETSSPGSGDTVLHDKISRAGKPSEYELSAKGYNEKIIGEESELIGYAHHVTLTELDPGASYYFVCGGKDGGYSKEFKFKTIPKDPRKLKYVVLGDTRPGALDFPKGRNAVAKAAASHNPQFIIHTGDHIEHPFSGEEWQNYFNYIETLWVDSNGYLIPIIPVIGNHEVGTDNEFETTKEDARVYYSYMELPGNERWYSLDIAPYFKFLGLDSETYTDPASDQYSWLERELKAAGDTAWKFSAYHRPSFGKGYGGKGSSSKFLPLFDKYHVDFGVEGHVHMYTRSQPLNTSISNGKYFPYAKGTVHIVAGGGGAPLYSDYPTWWQAAGPISRYSFSVFEVSESSLRMKALDTDGNVIDRMEVHKELSRPKTVVRARETGYAADNSGPPPFVEFGEGTKPPIMKISKVGKGMVAAAGLAWSSVDEGWKSGELDVLFSETFNQMTREGKKVLWYEGYEANYSTEKCSHLVKALEDEGFEVEGVDKEPITKELLSIYDILVIPQLGLGSPFNGGNPDLLPWADVKAIEEFVRSGNGLLVMDAHDYGGHNWAKVQNKILAGVGADMALQSDGIYDWVDNWNRGWFPMADVIPTTAVGKKYKQRTGETKIGVFEASSVINNPSLYLKKIPGGEKSIVDGRKSKADARVLIKTNKGGASYVRIQKTPVSSVSEEKAGVHKPLVEVSVRTEIPPEQIDWPVTLEIYYSQDSFNSSLLENENQLEMYYWDSGQGTWRRCQEIGVNSDRNVVVASIYHFTKFAIMSDPK